MKKRKNIEMRLYELLGVKTFRKMAFKFRDILAIPFTIKMTKEERKDFLCNSMDNYSMGKVKSLEDVKKYKKYILFNTSVHVIGLFICLPHFLEIINGTAYLSIIFTNLIAICINVYCLMLQRYNCIRINKLIKKMTLVMKKRRKKLKKN